MDAPQENLWYSWQVRNARISSGSAQLPATSDFVPAAGNRSALHAGLWARWPSPESSSIPSLRTGGKHPQLYSPTSDNSNLSSKTVSSDFAPRPRVAASLKDGSSVHNLCRRLEGCGSMRKSGLSSFRPAESRTLSHSPGSGGAEQASGADFHS